jgi:hypothetical protein
MGFPSLVPAPDEMGFLPFVNAVNGLQVFFALPGSHIFRLVDVGKHAGVVKGNKRIQQALARDDLTAIGHSIIIKDSNPEFAGTI